MYMSILVVSAMCATSSVLGCGVGVEAALPPLVLVIGLFQLQRPQLVLALYLAEHGRRLRRKRRVGNYIGLLFVALLQANGQRVVVVTKLFLRLCSVLFRFLQALESFVNLAVALLQLFLFAAVQHLLHAVDQRPLFVLEVVVCFPQAVDFFLEPFGFPRQDARRLLVILGISVSCLLL